MLTKNTITYLKSLHTKEWRSTAQVFLVEWEKNIVEFLDSDFEFLSGYFSEAFVEKYGSKLDYPGVQICSVNEIEKVTSLVSNKMGVAVFAMKKDVFAHPEGIVLVLDGINDPGNLWTIMRTADWYGIDTIIASKNTVDAYNPKVIMATMWSFSRVNVYYRDLAEYLSKVDGPVYGAYLEGEDVHALPFVSWTMHLVIWSESHGITAPLREYITQSVTIPRFGRAESLNAGIATAIILDNIRRSMGNKRC